MKNTTALIHPPATWESLSPEEKNLEFFRRQRDVLATFLANGAISLALHDKSLTCLIEKMGIFDII